MLKSNFIVLLNLFILIGIVYVVLIKRNLFILEILDLRTSNLAPISFFELNLIIPFHLLDLIIRCIHCTSIMLRHLRTLLNRARISVIMK